jgi:hypothetical protein
MAYNSSNLKTQNELLMKNLMEFYKTELPSGEKNENFKKMMSVVNGESNISLRIIDWFVTNYAKKEFIVYNVSHSGGFNSVGTRFKVYTDYKLKLKAYSKKNFDPFCRWERVTIPYEDDKYIETTIGQLNFFKWAIENKIVEYIHENYSAIESDMNLHNSTSKKKQIFESISQDGKITKTRKKREELSISAVKCVRKENVKITVMFS